jgi:inner membrane protein involved in colicin E2 resistance
MDDDRGTNTNDSEWVEEVLDEGKQIHLPMLAIPFKTIAVYFQKIFGPLIHSKIIRHPTNNAKESVSAHLPPGFHEYLFYEFKATKERKIIIQYLDIYSTKVFDTSFAIISNLNVNLASDKKTEVSFEYLVFNSYWKLQAPRSL